MSFNTVNLVVVEFGEGGSRLLGTLNTAEAPAHAGDFHRILVDANYQIYLFAAPIGPGPREELMREVFAEGAHGYIFVVDCLQATLFPIAQATIAKFRAYTPVPALLAADNLARASLSAEGLQEALGLSPALEIMPCVVSDAESAKAVVVRAFNKALGHGQDDTLRFSTPPSPSLPHGRRNSGSS